MKKVMNMVMALLGIKGSLPKKEGKYHLTQEQKDFLNSELENTQFADQFLEKANATLENERLTQEQRQASERLSNLLAENGIEGLFKEEQESAETQEQQESESTQAGQSGSGAAPPSNPPKPTPNLNSRIDALENLLNEQSSTIRTLQDSPEEDNAPRLNINGQKPQNLKHSATHLYASGRSYDAFASRPWNANALKLAQNPDTKVQATDWWDAPNIDKINQDLADYFRLELDQVIDFMEDYRGVPSWWEVISNVTDEVAYSAMLTSEITQGRGKNWLPKNKQKFVAIKGQVYGVKIDIEYSGYELQKIERSWMNRYNREGSQAYKMSFVRFLVSRLLQKARQEDSHALIKGVYVPDELRTSAQSFLFRERGVLQLIKQNRGSTFLPFDMGKPTAANIVDYAKDMAERLPDDKQATPGLIMYMSKSWERAYKEKRKMLDGLMPTYEPGEMTVENFPNITIFGMDFLDGEDIIWITTRDNHKILQNIGNERSLLQFERLKRDIFVFGDYKQGAHVDAFGAQWTDGQPVDFSNQQFWSNNVEVLLDVKVPLPADDTTPSVKYHNVVKTGANTGATAITNLDDAVDGEYYYVYGNSEGTAATIASGTNFDLASSITLDGSMMLKLYKRPGGKFAEVERIEITQADAIILDADATKADASLGTRFITSANSGATAFTDIENAVKDTVYRLEGGSSTNATTIAASGKFNRITASMSLTAGSWIDVVYNGGSFVELNRNNA